MASGIIVDAYEVDIVLPNDLVDPPRSFFDLMTIIDGP
jgi:hypothetical protein